MSNGVNNDNNENKAISINELQKKITSSESTIYTEQGMKSIFDAYNTNKKSKADSVEVLDSNEMQELVNDMKSYDGKVDGNNDGVIDIQEAELFVKDFNEKHKDSQIQTSDLFGFVENFFKREKVNKKSSIPVKKSVETVGKPLSHKTVSLVASVDGEAKDIDVDIELYATKDKKYLLLYKYGATKGSEFEPHIAKEYGYTGENAWNEFITNSLNFDPNTYEINFMPMNKGYKNTKVNDLGGVSSATSLSKLGKVGFVPPTEEELRKIDNRYSNPDMTNTIKVFCDFLKESIAQAELDLNNDEKTYGWAEKVADSIGELRDVNTMANMRELIANSKKYLYMMMNADNSPEGIKSGKDFITVFKNFTGKKDFNEKEIMKFLQTKQKYDSHESVIKTYKYIKNNLNGSVKEYAKYYYSNQFNSDFKADQYNQTKTIEAYDNMYNMFASLTGMSKDNFHNLLDEIISKGEDPIEFLKNFSSNIIAISEQNVKETLGLKDLKNLDDYEDNLKDEYDDIRKIALGDDGDLVNRISKYNDSQIIGGSVVSGVAQMGLYAACMAICPEFAFAKGIQAASSTVRGSVGAIESVFSNGGRTGMSYALTATLKQASTSGSVLSLLSKEGLKSGSSYALSSIVVDSTNRLADDIDEDNFEAFKSVGKTAAIEFLAGYFFDGFLKAKIFKKGETKVIEKEDAVKADFQETGEKFLGSLNIRFDAGFVGKIAATRAVAGGIGGTKDSVKETFKESCSGQYSISSIGLAFVAGAISNATMIKFKNSSFTKEEHKILGKFIEKAPKKGTKNDITAYLNSLEPDEQVYVKDYLQKVKVQVLEYMNNHSDENGAEEVLQYIKSAPDVLDEMIINYAAIEDSINIAK